MILPPRLLGYGAYNLAHDKYMGKPYAGGPIFYKYLRDGGWPVNLVKVICFRYAGQDGLDPARWVSLYDSQQRVNTAFIDNLSNTVDQARQFGFWVQVCLFSFQSVVGGEAPENAPAVFNLLKHPQKPASAGESRDRLRAFFNSDNAAVFGEQSHLVQLIADRLRVYPNVLWELANELRISDLDYPPNADNCLLVTWLDRMRGVLVRALQGAQARVTTSSGLQNQSERFFFHRLAADGCPSPALPVEFFDFHKGQWFGGGNFTDGIPAAKRRAAGYNPSAFLIINDDGSMGTADPASIQQWATAAYRNGAHYAAKQTYPPAQPWNITVLNNLKLAFNS